MQIKKLRVYVMIDIWVSKWMQIKGTGNEWLSKWMQIKVIGNGRLFSKWMQIKGIGNLVNECKLKV